MEIYSKWLVALASVLLLTRWLTRKADPAFSWKLLLAAIGAKILLGSFYGWLYLHRYGGDDTWFINNDSIQEMQKLLHRPAHFFEDLDLFRMAREFGWKEGFRQFLQKLELAMLIKPLAIANLWSGGNYYINIVFFSGLSFWGHFWLFRLVTSVRPRLRTWTFWVIFLYPPTLFWLSGIRGDALFFFFFSLTLWQFYRWMASGRRGPLLLWMMAFAGMLLVRPAEGFLLLPALAGWWLTADRKIPVVKSFVCTYAIAILVFFLSGFLSGPLNLPQSVVNRQAEFFSLQANTRVALDSLGTNPVDFVLLLPKALDNSFLRPYPFQANGILLWAMVVQNIFIICILVMVLVRRNAGRQLLTGTPVFIVFLLFSISGYLSIGYTIPFPGALIRYRAIPELCFLLVTGIAAMGEMITDYNLFNVYKKKVK